MRAGMYSIFENRNFATIHLQGVGRSKADDLPQAFHFKSLLSSAQLARMSYAGFLHGTSGIVAWDSNREISYGQLSELSTFDRNPALYFSDLTAA